MHQAHTYTYPYSHINEKNADQIYSHMWVYVDVVSLFSLTRSISLSVSIFLNYVRCLSLWSQTKLFTQCVIHSVRYACTKSSTRHLPNDLQFFVRCRFGICAYVTCNNDMAYVYVCISTKYTFCFCFSSKVFWCIESRLQPPPPPLFYRK